MGGKLQWKRDIPQEALDNLVALASNDFHKNLGKIIHDIYLTGHNLFKDMPQGDHKKRAKYVRLQDANEDPPRQLEDRSRGPDQPEEHYPGSVRDLRTVHLGTGQVLVIKKMPFS